MPVALLSVFDKTGIADLARRLDDCGWRLVSSGGTAAEIAAHGIPVTDLADLTGVPAILGHRVVTLHPKVHGAILADVDQADHRDDLRTYGIDPIDLVVVNLYPFEDEPGVERIDIGGPTLVRAAAKNSARVGVVVDPCDYGAVAEEIAAHGALGAATRKRLANTAWQRIAAYDAAIAAWALSEPAEDSGSGAAGDDAELPATIEVRLQRAEVLRYGENPHQHGARYRIAGQAGWWDSAEQLGGKAMSYLNVLDAEAAWQLVNQFGRPACVVVKHANPCGVAEGEPDEPIAAVYQRAHECDPTSAFGGIVAVNRPLTGPMATELAKVFTEVVVAPEVDDEARTVLAGKPNLRVLRAPAPRGEGWHVRSIDGGMLVQTVDSIGGSEAWQVVSSEQPDTALLDELAFAWRVVAAVASNAIVLTKERQAVGIGGGQPNRVDSARLAVERASGRAEGGVCASDAFFPFRDTLDTVAAAGVRAVIQPGGSVRDEESIAAANEHGLVLVFTGERHFRH